ncbi:flavin-containing monooxygenase [Nocardia sp. NBC_01388]|uniref:flavin-containing monooxygenase n=1 Tax=Nocardia sp. NBC_01388 TaxID=2903596 RepID=UPI0032458CA7
MTVECKRVVVVGAGIAGLVTAKVLRDDGFDVTVVEKESAIGGVWAPSRTYPGLRTNNSRETYAFSDHPYEHGADVFPTAEQVRAYLASYVARFELDPLIRLSTEVIEVARHGQAFAVAVVGPQGREHLSCDFVVVCAGTYSEPEIPRIAGIDRFAGTVVHSSEATGPALFTGKRVVVVGAGKSALDCAAWAAEHAQRCTLVFRTPHWMAPRWFPGRVPADQVLLGRVTELFLPYHRRDRVERFLHGRGRVLTRIFWRTVELLLRVLLRMPPVLVPDQRLPHGLENAGFTSEFYDLVRHGRIDLRRDTIAEFGDDAAVRLTGGDRLEADIVLFATGWRQTLPFLTAELLATVLQDSQFRLYRHILPPTEPRLGFVGYASSTACQLTSEVSAHWLSQVFGGGLTLPGADAMSIEIDRVQSWLAEEFPGRAQGFYVGPHLIHHIDELLTDMGVSTRRTRNVVTEYFGTFTPARYTDLTEQRQSLQTSEQPGSSGSDTGRAG